MANKKKPSEKQAFLAEQRKAKRKESEKAKRKKHRTKKTVTAIVCCAAAVAVVAGGTTWFVREKPMTQLLSAGKTAHYKLNAAEVSFYAWQIYNGYITSNSESGSSNVPDTSKPLADQNYDNDTTWEAYFTDAAEEYAKNILAFCEAADAENYTPEEDISSLVASAKKQIDFSTMPDTVKEENVTHALELYFKAQSFSTHIQDNFNFTEEELNAYYEKNPTEMDVCSYMEFSFSYDDSSDSSTISQSQAEELARNLRRCDTKESFEQWVHDYYAQNTSLTEEELASQVKTLCMEDVSYTQNDSISEWAFSADTKVGDSKLFTDTDNKTITVCLLTAAPERDETHPVNLRQILFTANTYDSASGAHDAAEKALEEWNASDKEETTFAALADQYTEDTSVSGGLYQNVTRSQLMTTWRDWCFDESRKAGDVTILDSSYISCLIYYVGASQQPGWQLTAEAGLEEERYNELQEKYQKEANVQISDWIMQFVKVNNQDS